MDELGNLIFLLAYIIHYGIGPVTERKILISLALELVLIVALVRALRS